MLWFLALSIVINRFSMAEFLPNVLQGKTIMAVGDSLTFGAHLPMDSEPRPYTIRLGECLKKTANVNIVNVGVSGMTSHEMADNIHNHTETYRPTLTIILSGTNDVLQHFYGYGHIEPEETIHTVTHLHAVALKAALHTHVPTFTIAITIPQIVMATMEDPSQRWDTKEMDDANRKRYEVNSGLREFAERCSERVRLLDLENAFDQRDSNNLKFWSAELLHFSPLGYDAIGEMLCEKIESFPIPSVWEEDFFGHCFPGARSHNHPAGN